MKLLIPILFILFYSLSYGKEKLWVGWLIYPEAKSSSLVEMWKENGVLVWKLLDSDRNIVSTMKQPSIPDGYSYNPGGCSIDGTYRWDVIVSVMHSENKSTSSKVYQVWVADPKNGFTLMKPTKVECANEGFGI